MEGDDKVSERRTHGGGEAAELNSLRRWLSRPTPTCRPSSSVEGSLVFSAACIVWICIDTADNTASSKRLNSSKQPQAPHFTKPMKIRPIDFTSIPWGLCKNIFRIILVSMRSTALKSQFHNRAQKAVISQEATPSFTGRLQYLHLHVTRSVKL